MAGDLERLRTALLELAAAVGRELRPVLDWVMR